MSAVQQMLMAYGGAAGDPYFAYVKFLLHCDGSNGSTTFVDNSSYARTITPTGGTVVSTSDPKFGTGATALSSNTDSLTVPQTSGDLQPYTQDFTYELWVKASAINSQGMFGGLWTAGGGGGSVFFFGSYLGDIVFYDGTTFICQAASPNLATSWNHVAVTRQGTTFRVFVNGTLLTSGTSSVNLNSGGTGNTRTFDIGTFGGNTGLSGQVDDIRYTLGVARYTSNFTPPTGPFPNS